MPIYEIDDLIPSLADSVYVADAATVIGNATLCEDVSVWSSAVIRADNDSIFIGAGTNIQEGAVLHADPDFPLKVGKQVTIGHQAMLHGCTIEDNVLIGMGAIVMDGVFISKNSIIAAGSIVLEGTHIESGVIYAGCPAKKVKQLEEEQILELINRTAENYLLYASWY